MSFPQVLVTGATGKTGSIVYQKLKQNPDFQVKGLARSSEKAQELFGSTEGIYFGDITDQESIKAAFADCHKLVILTSASPQMVAPPKPGERPQFSYPAAGTPELVDYQGQKNQIDLAIAAGIEQVVLVGSMGGTDENNPLNMMGNGKILIWKRKAEEYLVNSGLNYTIIRAGGLLDQPGGVRKLLVGDNDELLINPPEGVKTSIPRADVAETVVQALQKSTAINKAFDLISCLEENSQGSVTKDFKALFEQATPAYF
ncbi:MAG: SDR family oxidoreductase [Cyanobacteria bacterium J06621_12]